MPTARGWTIAAAGLLLLVLGFIFGTTSLEQLGFALIFLVGVAVFLVRRSRHVLTVERTTTPEKVQAGREVTVHLSLRNAGRGPAPLLLLEDTLPTELSARARFAVNGIEAGGTRETSYLLKPPRRGRFTIGPLRAIVSDPFGVARTERELSGRTTFLSYPRTEPLGLPRDSGNRRTMQTSAKRQPTGAQGEDFYTLREYVEGDDLRRISWSATAKRNRYMIRQEETPWHARATILLDDRSGSYERAGWERAVEAAASLADLYHRSGYTFRLTAAGETGLQANRGSDHFHRCLDLLAGIDLLGRDLPEDPLVRRLVELESQSHVEGALIFVGGEISPSVAHGLIRAARSFKMVTAISLPPRLFAAGSSGESSSLGTPILERAGVRSLEVGPGETLSGAWTAMWRTSGKSGIRAHEGGENAWDRKQEHA